MAFLDRERLAPSLADDQVERFAVEAVAPEYHREGLSFSSIMRVGLQTPLDSTADGFLVADNQAPVLDCRQRVIRFLDQDGLDRHLGQVVASSHRDDLQGKMH